MAVVSILFHVDFGRNDRRASNFIIPPISYDDTSFLIYSQGMITWLQVDL